MLLTDRSDPPVLDTTNVQVEELPICTSPKSWLVSESTMFGGEITVIRSVLVSVSDPPGPLTVKLTVYVPALLYVWDGLDCVLVPPSPKLQE